MTDRFVIVGGGPAGLAAARGYREAGGRGEVVMLTADEHPPYHRPPLTKDYLQGSMGADELPIVQPGWYDEHAVRLRLRSAAVSVDAARHRVRLADGESIGYSQLVLATGSRPKPLPVPGADHPALVYVRDRASGDRLRALATEPGRRVAVLGAGFIGCEAAASLAVRGLDVVLGAPEERPHESRLGPEAGEQIAGWLQSSGVRLVLGEELVRIDRSSPGWSLQLGDGSSLAADAVVCGGGATPNVELAERAGLRLENGGVRTDDRLRTSDPTIFAVGDIAYATNGAAGRPLRVEHWGEAEAHGEIAGTVAAGGDRTWSQAPGFWSTIGDRTLKYAAWGDGHDDRHWTGTPRSWAVWYAVDGHVVGVLTHNDDASYERGRALVERRAPVEEALPG